MNKMETIHFREINKSEPVMAIVALQAESKAETIKQMNEFFNRTDVFKFGSKLEITDMKRIVGNVLGEEGRTDYLLVFNKNPERYVNGLRRIAVCTDLKWIDDYLTNYSNDYEVLSDSNNG